MKKSILIIIGLLMTLFIKDKYDQWKINNCKPQFISDDVYMVNEGCQLPEGFKPETSEDFK